MGGDAPAAAVFCSGPQSRGQNFIRAPSKQIHIFAPGILLAEQCPLPPGSPFLVIFSTPRPRLGWSRGKEMTLVLTSWLKACPWRQTDLGFNFSSFSS